MTARCVSRRTPQSRASSTYCLSRWSGSTNFYWVLFPQYFVCIPVHILFVGFTLVPILIPTATFSQDVEEDLAALTEPENRHVVAVGRLIRVLSTLPGKKLSPIWFLKSAGQFRHEGTRI